MPSAHVIWHCMIIKISLGQINLVILNVLFGEGGDVLYLCL